MMAGMAAEVYTYNYYAPSAPWVRWVFGLGLPLAIIIAVVVGLFVLFLVLRRK
jgi:hypothetical protein